MNILRLLAILVLALPQVFAPLVHAHVGVDASPSKIHLPGLEMKSGLDEVVMESFSSGAYDGVVIDAEHGIRQHLSGFPSPSPLILPGFWPLEAYLQPTVRVAIFQEFSPKQICLFAFSRAPPA